MEREPDVHFRLVGLWRVFAIVQTLFFQDGLSGSWHRPAWSECRDIAEGCDEEWDAQTIDRLSVLLDDYFHKLPRKRK